MSQRGAKTSIDLLEERNALRERVERLERSIDAIAAEVDLAERHPDIVFLVCCRIRALAERTRSARPGHDLGRPPSAGRPGLARAAAFDAGHARARSA